MESHRCAESLKQKVSIKYANPYRNVRGVDGWGDMRWWLFSNEIDNEWENHYQHPVCHITLCPFCGEVLATIRKEI